MSTEGYGHIRDRCLDASDRGLYYIPRDLISDGLALKASNWLGNICRACDDGKDTWKRGRHACAAALLGGMAFANSTPRGSWICMAVGIRYHLLMASLRDRLPHVVRLNAKKHVQRRWIRSARF